MRRSRGFRRAGVSALSAMIIFACAGWTVPGQELNDIKLGDPRWEFKQCICDLILCMPKEVRMALSIKKVIGGLKAASTDEVKAFYQGQGAGAAQACENAPATGGITNPTDGTVTINMDYGPQPENPGDPKPPGIENKWIKKTIVCHEGRHSTGQLTGTGLRKWDRTVAADPKGGPPGLIAMIHGLRAYKELDAVVYSIQTMLLDTAHPTDEAGRAAKKAALEASKEMLERDKKRLCDQLNRIATGGIPLPSATENGVRSRERKRFEECKKQADSLKDAVDAEIAKLGATP